MLPVVRGQPVTLKRWCEVNQLNLDEANRTNYQLNQDHTVEQISSVSTSRPGALQAKMARNSSPHCQAQADCVTVSSEASAQSNKATPLTVNWTGTESKTDLNS